MGEKRKRDDADGSRRTPRESCLPSILLILFAVAVLILLVVIICGGLWPPVFPQAGPAGQDRSTHC